MTLEEMVYAAELAKVTPKIRGDVDTFVTAQLNNPDKPVRDAAIELVNAIARQKAKRRADTRIAQYVAAIEADNAKIPQP